MWQWHTPAVMECRAALDAHLGFSMDGNKDTGHESFDEFSESSIFFSAVNMDNGREYIGSDLSLYPNLLSPLPL